MKLHILGSGTFFVDKNISASSFVLDTGKKKLLIDCGPGTLVKLSHAGLKPEDIDYVFLTHFHPDHSSDLFPLFMNYRLSDIFEPGKLKKYPIFFGPEGISDFLLKYSQPSELPAYEGYDKIKVLEYKSEMKIEDFILKTFRTSHNAFNTQTKSYALRIEAEGKVIAFSGDSAKCKGVERVSENADIFVCDTSFPKEIITTSHMNTTDIGEISKKSKVKKLILDHFYPQFVKYDLIGEVRENFKGEIVKAKDLDVINF